MKKELLSTSYFSKKQQVKMISQGNSTEVSKPSSSYLYKGTEEGNLSDPSNKENVTATMKLG